MRRRTILGGGLALTLTIGTRVAGRRRRAPHWPGGARGAVSITYDDGLDSQLDLAVPALDALDLKATFFVTMKNIRHRLSDWAALPSRGHELGDHTVTHPCDLRRFTPHAFMAHEITPTERWLASVATRRAEALYAYPCDVTDLGPGSANDQARRYARILRLSGISAARTSEGEPNDPATLRRRVYRLQALAVGYDATDLPSVMQYLALAERRGHWAILIFHEISTRATEAGDVTRAMHDAVLQAVRMSSLWKAPMGEVLFRMM